LHRISEARSNKSGMKSQERLNATSEKGNQCQQFAASKSGRIPSKKSPITAMSSEASGLVTTPTLTQKRSVKPSTARQELKSLQAAINHWHRESPLEAVPKVTLPKAGERRERVLEREEVARMLWACRKLSRTPIAMYNGAKMKRDYMHVARFILIGIYTGTRHDAILKLRWNASRSGGHVDLVRGIIYRRGSAEPETSKRRPPVNIPHKLCGAIARWRRSDAANAHEHAVIHEDGVPIVRMQKAWRTVVKAAGLGPDVTPHTLRHTAASWLLWQGKTIWEVAGVIGADASTVERVYGHHRKAEK
jgi:integrase